MKKIILSIAILALVLNLSAQKYHTKTGVIKFLSKTKLEDIKAENRKVVSELNSVTGDLQFLLLMKGFDFPNQLMEDHFNETYAESTKYPKASFKGKLIDVKKVDFTKDGTYTADVTGKLTIKNITKDVVSTVTFVVKGGKVTATAHLDIKLKDYNIVIPAIAEAKIAESIGVDIIMDYTKK
ncbi:MAG: YceI family protein [Bacteroidetes bacterium]|nr:YceI family protein [Bacteroidota bacterium]